MGNSCTQAADAVAHLVTETEIHQAVRSIEEWQKVQSTTVKNGGSGQNMYGPLLQRVGGLDVVKKVVELFYRKLYGDPRLILFLHDQDVMHLRAKQSAFISWLFGPPNVPYLGRSVRIAHLRIIKQRGFNGDDFDLGMKYFEQAMAELGAPETIIGEVMRRLRPFKDAFFTASAKDAEEEARWAAEEREKEEAARQQMLQEQEEQAFHERERWLQEQITLSHEAAVAEAEAEADGGKARGWAADAAVAEAVAMPLSGEALSRATARPASRSSLCPFTGVRLSRPNSDYGGRSDAASGSGMAMAAAAVAAPPPRPWTPPPLTLGVVADSSMPSVIAVVSGTTATASGVMQCTPASSGQTAPQLEAMQDGGLDRPDSSNGAAAAVAGCVPPSPTAPPPSTPPAAATDRPGPVPTTANPTAATKTTTTTTATSEPSAAAAVAHAAAFPTSLVATPGPISGMEAELNDIVNANPEENGWRMEQEPLLPPPLVSSSSALHRTAAVC